MNEPLKKDKPFVHLHVHTQYSLLDGAAKIEELFGLCESFNMPAIAITDHGNMFGVLEFMKNAVKYTDPNADFYEFMQAKKPFKVKPIIGCEVYVAEDMNVKVSDGGKMPKFNHLVLLAKNLEGYQNLIKLVSFSYTKGLYYKPRIDMSLLKEYSQGLICLSACLAGAIPQALLKNDLDKADALAKEFKSIFNDDFYIEIQDHDIKRQKQILPHLVNVARSNNIKLVATNDVHYITKKDADLQKVLQCISFRTTLEASEVSRISQGYELEPSVSMADEDDTGDEGYFPTREFYLKSRDEMEQIFPYLTEALDNSVEIASKCDCYFFEKKQLLPNYTPPDGSTPPEFLRRLTFEGLNKKYKTITKDIHDRAEYELNVIESMGFVEYFLIVWDFIHYAESKGIPVGPGRGSGVGSIVAYSIGITKVNPIKYELIFERFLNPERVSSPDFDIDFCVDRRNEVISYVVEKYGIDNVSQIITFGTLAAKAAVKDVGRVYNHPYAEVEKITKLMPSLMGNNHIGDLIGVGKPSAVIGELVEMYETDPMVKSIIDMAIKIEGMPRQTGMHAAGVIICKDPIYEHIPMAKTSDNFITTEFDMVECEELGLLKMDFLGLRTLTDIKKAIDIIEVSQGKTIDFYDMEYEDEGVFALIGEGDTHAVFQLESEGMKRFMRDLKPTCLEDIIAGVSLYRPGPMDKIGDYVNGKRNIERIKYDHPLMKDILEVTYGVMVYQEQVMKAVQVLAGYTLGRADELRRIMSKKKKDKMESERKVFLYGLEKNGVSIPGAIKNGVPQNIANKIFDDMTSFASYAFNKSHAAAYAYLAYQTAYLKKYYTVEYITAVLNNRIASIDEIRNYLTYLKEKNIEVLPPDINKSKAEFSVENQKVRIGLAAIKNVGSTVISEIVREREQGGEYKDFTEFVSRLSNITLNKRMLESLIYAGAFDCFNKARSQLIQVYDIVLTRAAKEREQKNSMQFSFFENEAFEKVQALEYPNVPEFSLADKLKYEREVAGVYLTGHPLEEYTAFLKEFNINSSHFSLKDESEDDEAISTKTITDNASVNLGGMLIEATKRYTKAGKELGIGRLEDLYGTVEVIAPQHVLVKYRELWKADKVVAITGKAKERDGVFNIWVDKIEEATGQKSLNASAKKICIYLSFSAVEDNIVDKLSDVFSFYPGMDLVYIKDIDTDSLFSLGKTGISQMLLNELYGIVGEDSVKIV